MAAKGIPMNSLSVHLLSDNNPFPVNNGPAQT